MQILGAALIGILMSGMKWEKQCVSIKLAAVAKQARFFNNTHFILVVFGKISYSITVAFDYFPLAYSGKRDSDLAPT